MPLLHPDSSKFVAVKDRLLSLDPISYAKQVYLIFRQPKKIIISNLLLSYWLLLSRHKFSYRCWASELSLLQEEKVQGDSIRRYMTPEMLTFVQGLLRKSLETRYSTFMESKGFEVFPAVYVQDATHFQLPKHLSAAFPGSGGVCEGTATAKIQAVLSLKYGQFTDFQLGSFRNNDQGDALRFVEHLNTGDLLIRDLGYFKLGAFQAIAQKKAYFLSRYRPGVVVTDAQTKKRIPLLKTLKKKQFIDMDVIIGTKDSVKCRLIAVPVPEEVAQKRREKAAKDRHKDANHSEEYMKLLSYSIFITNVPVEIWALEQVVKAYKCRWYIEILFKGWKSHLRLGKNFPEGQITEFKARFFIYASLLMVTMIVMPAFSYLQKRVQTKGRQVSILRLCEFINSFLSLILMTDKGDFLVEVAENQCCYQKRRKPNMVQMILSDF